MHNINGHGRRRRPHGYIRSSARAFAIFALALSAGRASGQDTIATHSSLRLNDVYAVVQRSNPRSSAARALVSAAEARVPGAKRLPDPELQFGLMNRGVPNLAPMPQVGMTQLQVMQMIPLAGKLALSGRVAESKASAEAARADDVSWEVRSQAAMAFYDLYASDRALDVARETLRLLQDIGRTAESMYRVGEGRQADVLRANVEIARMAEDTVRMLAMRETMIARLNALMDRPADSALGVPRLPAFPDSLPARQDLDGLAAGNRAMVRAGIDELKAAETAEQLARKEIIPDVRIGLQYGQRGGEMGTDRMASLMVGATIPVFARDRQFRMREEAGAMRQMAAAELAAMRAQTRGEVAQAYAALSRARNLARLYRTTVLPQAEASVASALAAYRVGAVDFMTLLDNRMAVNRYRQDLITLEAEEGKAWADLEMLTGRELLPATTTNDRSAAASAPGGMR